MCSGGQKGELKNTMICDIYMTWKEDEDVGKKRICVIYIPY